MYIRDRKVIISAAITGATHVPSLSPYLPKNPDEIIRSAIEANRAGAAVVHIHARDIEGKPTTDHGIFCYILSSIARECDAVIGITTGCWMVWSRPFMNGRGNMWSGRGTMYFAILFGIWNTVSEL